MTVSTTNTRNSYSGNGSTTVFAYTFKIFDDDDITVIVRTDSTGVEATKTKTTHYTVSGVGSASGGNITFGSAPASGETVVLLRTTARTQLTDYTPNDPFPAATHEDALDKLTLIAQELQEEVGRSLKLSQTNTIATAQFTVGAADRANKILGFDTNGDLAIFQEIGTFKGTDATTTTAAYIERDIVKSTTAGQLNNVYIALQDSPAGTALTNTTYWALLVDAVSAATSATNAASSATASANSATASANSATASASSATSAATTLTTFQNQYHGAASSDPTSNLDAGDLYFNTSSGNMKVHNGSAFIDVVSAVGNLANVVEDTSPQLGANLDTNSHNILIDDAHFIADENGNEQIIFQTTSSAVNQFDVANAATGSPPKLSATGDDSNIDLDLEAKGTGHVTIRGNTNPGAIQFNCESNSHGQTVISQPHSASVTNVLTLPAGSDQEIVGTSATQTLTNKSIVATQLTGTIANARLDAQLQDVAGLAVTDGGFIVGDGSNFVLETAGTARTSLGLGTAAVTNTGTSAGNTVVLDGSARLPAVDGSQLTNISSSGASAGFAVAMAIAL